MAIKNNILALKARRARQATESPFWINCHFSLRDLWIGLYWRRLPAHYPSSYGHVREEVHLYLCLLPFFPVHMIWASRIE